MFQNSLMPERCFKMISFQEISPESSLDTQNAVFLNFPKVFRSKLDENFDQRTFFPKVFHLTKGMQLEHQPKLLGNFLNIFVKRNKISRC